MTDRADADNRDRRGYPKRLVQTVKGLRPEKPGSEPLVDRGIQNRHHGCASVDPPERHFPVGLPRRSTVVIRLVRFGISLQIGVLVDTNDDVDGSPRDPGVESVGNVQPFAARLSDCRPSDSVRHDDESLSLAEPCGRSADRSFDDPLDGFLAYGVIGVVPYHSSAPYDVPEFHALSSRESRLSDGRLSDCPTADGLIV